MLLYSRNRSCVISVDHEFLSSNMMVITTLDAVDPLQMDLVLETLPIQS